MKNIEEMDKINKQLLDTSKDSGLESESEGDNIQSESSDFICEDNRDNTFGKKRFDKASRRSDPARAVNVDKCFTSEAKR